VLAKEVPVPIRPVRAHELDVRSFNPRLTRLPPTDSVVSFDGLNDGFQVAPAVHRHACVRATPIPTQAPIHPTPPHPTPPHPTPPSLPGPLPKPASACTPTVRPGLNRCQLRGPVEPRLGGPLGHAAAYSTQHGAERKAYAVACRDSPSTSAWAARVGVAPAMAMSLWCRQHRPSWGTYAGPRVRRERARSALRVQTGEGLLRHPSPYAFQAHAQRG
jgi:hypothetical protein